MITRTSIDKSILLLVHLAFYLEGQFMIALVRFTIVSFSQQYLMDAVFSCDRYSGGDFHSEAMRIQSGIFYMIIIKV